MNRESRGAPDSGQTSCPIQVETAGATLSGVAADPRDEPRGLILALHGGGSRAGYFDSPVARESSLIRLAATLGWRCVALDRPGYGASEPVREQRLGSAAQAELLRDPLRQLGGSLPVLLVGHSLGSITTLRLALSVQEEPDSRLIGVALGGAPLAYTADQRSEILLADTDGPTLRRLPGQRRRAPEEWFGPSGAYPPEILDLVRQISDTVPSGELPDSYGAPEILTELLSQLRIPVQFVVAEHERTMAPAKEVLDLARQAVPQLRGSEMWEMLGSGHNLSLGYRARAYHLRLLAFAEECLASFNARHGQVISHESWT